MTQRQQEAVARAIRAETRGISDDGSPIIGDFADYVGDYMEIARVAIEAFVATADGSIPPTDNHTGTDELPVTK